MDLVDTHCHIQFPDYPVAATVAINNAKAASVTRLIVVGCSLEDSILAVEFAQQYPNVWAAIGLHPHEAAKYVGDPKALQSFRYLAGKPKVVAIGETGLDYFYEHSPQIQQIEMLKFQLDLAQEHNLPLIFHIRDAFDDFWPIFDECKQNWPAIRGVVHSFSAGTKGLEQIQKRNLYVGLNGIMTFTKKPDQLAAAKALDLKKMLLETDSPFLTPTPYRGTINEPKHIRGIAEFLAGLRGDDLSKLAQSTTNNAMELFNLR